MTGPTLGSKPNLDNISTWAIRHPVPTILVFLILTIAGLLSYRDMRINNAPEVDLPAVNVIITQPGASPSELENQVTRRVENALTGLVDLKRISSTITDNKSATVVSFKLTKSIDRAVTDVRDRVSQIRADLPGDIRDPIVTRVEITGGAILTGTVTSDRLSIEELSWFVDNTLNRVLLSVPGAANVSRIGGVNREIRVKLNPDRLAALGITAVEVNQQLRETNLNRPSGRGTLGDGEQVIRTIGTSSSVADLAARRIVLSGGRTALLSDLGSVEDAAGEVRTTALLNNKPVVAFELTRSRGSSEIEVTRKAREKMAELAANTPGLSIQEVASTTPVVEAQYEGAANALAAGAFLAMIVVFIFLRDWRATLITSLAMPLSLIPTFFVLRVFDYSFNTVTLLALTLVIGVLVDDAIVEIENIVRHMEKPDITVFDASLEAAAEIAMAVVATTLAIVAIFLPVSFMPGVPGQYFRQFGLTIVTSVLFSLLVARLLTPLMSAYLLKLPKKGQKEHTDGRLMRGYLQLLALCLRNRIITMFVGLLIFLGSVALIPRIPTDFITATDISQSILSLELQPGSNLTSTEAVVREVTDVLLSHDEVISVFAGLGVTAGSGFGGGPALTGTLTTDPRMAALTITLRPKNERKRPQSEVEAITLKHLEQFPGLRFGFNTPGGGTNKVTVNLTGDDAEKLDALAEVITNRMRGIPGLFNVTSSADLARPELQIRPRPDRAAEFGASPAALAQTMRIATVGDIDQTLARFVLSDRDIPIRVMLSEDARNTIDTLSSLRVTGRNGLSVPFSNLAEITLGSGASQIQRLDRSRIISISAEIGTMPLGEATKKINKLPELMNLPKGIAQKQLGDQENMAELFGGFSVAITVGILLVYVLLAVLFNDFLQPFTILTSLPFSLSGALLGLLITGKSLGVSAVIGILMLMGVVAKNSILLVEYAVELLNSGLDTHAALTEAAHKRARPIIMTTIAMTAGMAEVAIGLGQGAEFRAPMAISVIGGLITSTLLSLVFVPVVFSSVHTVEGWMIRIVRRRTIKQAHSEPEAAKHA